MRLRLISLFKAFRGETYNTWVFFVAHFPEMS